MPPLLHPPCCAITVQMLIAITAFAVAAALLGVGADRLLRVLNRRYAIYARIAQAVSNDKAPSEKEVHLPSVTRY
jgi:hypothetical protein